MESLTINLEGASVKGEWVPWHVVDVLRYETTTRFRFIIPTASTTTTDTQTDDAQVDETMMSSNVNASSVKQGRNAYDLVVCVDQTLLKFALSPALFPLITSGQLRTGSLVHVTTV